MIRCLSCGIPIPLSLTSNAKTVAARFKTGCSGLHPELAARNAEPHPSVLGELERVREEVLQHLLQALGIGDHRRIEHGVDVHVQRELPVFGFVTERPGHAVHEVLEQDVLGHDRHRAGFDLREIEDVGDQVQQVRSRAVDGAARTRLAWP